MSLFLKSLTHRGSKISSIQRLSQACLINKSIYLKSNNLTFASIRSLSNEAHKDQTFDNRILEFGVMTPKLKKYLEEEKKYDGKLIYVGQLTRQLKSAKFLSLSSSLLGIMLMPFLTDSLSTSSIFAQLFVFGTTGFFIFVTPMFSQFLGRRYVSRLYYNYEEKKFKAVLFSFFMFEYKLEFSLSDVVVPDMPGPFSTVKVKPQNRSLFIDLHQITDVELAQKIYGYDKPFDIKKYTEKDEDD